MNLVYILYRNLKIMAPENSTAQITSGSRGLKVMIIIFVTSYVVLAGTVGFLVYDRVSRAAEQKQRTFMTIIKQF